MFKKHMTPLSPKGDLVAHKGKGSAMAAMPDRGQIKQLAKNGSINDYAKAAPTMQDGDAASPYDTYDLG